jgi:LysM repeat protein
VNRVWAARLAFPAAFLAGVTIAVLLVRAGLADDGTTAPIASLSVTGGQTTNGGTTTAAARRVFATVQSGDTLDEIALEHDTTVERLFELNPELDPTNLQIGQRVRVR